MAHPDLGGISDRLYEGFLAPLVVGGEMTPSKPIGGRSALAVGHERVIANAELSSHVQLGRCRAARKLAPVDRVESPTVAEWALGAVLHDLVQATHPGLRSAFRRQTPTRILALAEATLACIPAPTSIGEALSRHTWFARVFEIARTDTVVRWWVGSQTFLGTTPPSRLTAWPELRRVNIERTPRPLMDLPATAGALDDAAFGHTLSAFLAKTPLTDIATAHRTSPAFQWTSASLGLVGARSGRTLATRALSLGPQNQVDAALGRATLQLFKAQSWQAAMVALELLGERALAEAETNAGTTDKPLAPSESADDGSFARAAGALVARQTIATRGDAFSEAERGRLLASSSRARPLRSDATPPPSSNASCRRDVHSLRRRCFLTLRSATVRLTCTGPGSPR